MAQPTAQEQQMLEMINRIRLAPAAELSILLNSGDAAVANALSAFNVNISVLTQQWGGLLPTAPLAWSSQLSDAALGHNRQMIAAGVQSHQVAGEAPLGQRATNAGYTGWNALGENIYAYANSVFHGQASFAIDWGSGPNGIQSPAGHRNNILSSGFREVGIGVTAATGALGPLVVTQDFGNRFALNGKAWLLGVAFNDVDRDRFYDVGEGLSGITVQVIRSGTTTPIVTNTLSAGGYQILLDPGQYQLNFIQNAVLLKSENVIIDATTPVNVKRDLIVTPEGILNSSIKNDFGGDRRSDILWRNSNGAISAWQMDGYTVQNPSLIGSLTTDWVIQDTGDFNGDGKSDILWRNANGAISIWQMNGNTVQSASTLGILGNDWVIQDAADFNGDGISDILWRNANGAISIWQMNGSTVQSSSILGTLGNDWVIQESGDFNGDGKADILWRNTNGAISIWQMDGSTVQSAFSLGTLGTDWLIQGVDDFNGDGKDDILWRNANGAISIWQMDGSRVQSAAILGVLSNDWSVAGSGDYNGDGTADILWRNTNGAVSIWQVNNGIAASAAIIGSADSTWQIVTV